MWPKVSVVMPSYNQGQFIEESIRSVLLQGYTNLEYIIIDGGSTDGSVDIIRRYAPWLTSWTSEPDAGQSDAINKGWQHCTGDVLAWLNSDDLYAPDALRQVGERFAADMTLGLVYGEINVLDDAGRTSGAIGYHARESQMLAALELPYQPASFFSAAIIRQIGGLDVSLRYVMDVDILLRVMANARAARIAAPLASFRIHAESKTNLAEPKFAEELLMLLQRFEEKPAVYPGLEHVGIDKTRQNFYRLAAKHFYQGDRFHDALRCIALACRADPSATLSILNDEGVGWLVKRILPIEQYRALAHRVRSKPE